MPSTNILVGAGLIVVGVIVILLGIRKNIKCSGRTVGRIIGVRESQETDDEGFNHYYYPQFEYVVNGQTYRGERSTSYSKPQKIQIGGGIEVVYDPNEPSKCFTKGGGFILPFIGAMLIILGVIFLTSASNG